MSDQSTSSFYSVESRPLLFAGLLLQCLFIVGALVLFKERTLYADTAHFAAEITGGPGFYLGHRFIAFFSRWMPWLSASAGASIKTSLVLYSLNLAFVFTIPYLLITFVFKDRTMAFCLLIFQFLFTFRTFYLPISELQHGLVLLLVYWACIRHLNRKQKAASRSLILYGLLAILVNAHPLIILAFIASAVLFSEHKTYWRPGDQKILIASALLLFILSSLIFSTKYEAVILSDALGQAFTDIDTYKIRLMLHTLLSDYLPTMIFGLFGLLLLFIGYPFRKKMFLLFCMTLASVLIYLRFAHITFTLTFFEIYLLPVPFLLFMVISLEWEKISDQLRAMSLGILAVLIIFQVIRVAGHAGFYSNRLEIYTSVMDQMEEKKIDKVVLPFFKSPMNEIVDFYASPFESYLLSHIDDDPSNDGMLITYLLADEIFPSDYELYSSSFITLGMDSIDVHPFSRYPLFDLSEASYSTFNPVY